MRMETKHCLENQIFFFQTFWKDSLSKKLRWNMIFLVIIFSGKQNIAFPENTMYYRKDKISFSRKYDLTP